MSTESNLRPLSPFLKEKAKTELHEDEATRVQLIADLKRIYQERYPELKLKREDDLFLIRFLRARKFDVERAVAILYNYHQYLLTHPDMDQNPTAEDGKKITKNKLAGVFPHKAKNGATILYLQAENIDPDLLNAKEFQLGFGYLWNQLMEDEATQICGVVMLEDLHGFSFSKATKVRKFQDGQGGDADQYHFIQNCLPLRFKGVYLVHQPWWITFFVSVAKPFMSQKLRERFFYVGSNYNELEGAFDLKALPKQVGGELEFDFDSSHTTFNHWTTRAVVDV